MASTPSASLSGCVGGTSSATASSRASPAVGSVNAAPHAASSSSSSASIAPKSKTQVNSNGYHPTNPPVLLSAMRSAPLDLTSVERRGQPTTSREPPKRNRLYGLEDAPTYRPTEEEWRDPFEYVRNITPEARQFGICKIIPPDSWNPDFAIDTTKFHFRTRKQELNSVEGSTRANLTYLDALAKFHKQQGTNLNRLPYVDKKPLDLFRLKKAVESRGGFEKVCKTKKWAEIGRDLGYSGKIMSSLSTSLKNSYDRWLTPYENYLRQAKPGVYQQLEHEYGGPLTPSPAPSPIKRSMVNTPSSLRAESPARYASDVLQATLNAPKQESDRDTIMADAAPIPSLPSSGGFTAINSGGFTAVNSGFTSVNRPNPTDPKSFTPPPKAHGSPLPSGKNTPDIRPSTLGHATSLKRQLSSDSLDSTKRETGTDREDSESGSRRSKRLKKETVPTVAGSHMSVFRPSAPRIPAPRDESSSPGEKCETCGKGDDAGFVAICESCDHGYHGTCLDPPLKAKPDADWNCPRCLVGDGQFGFEEGGLYSLKQFQEKAAEFKQSYFESRLPYDPILNCARPVTEDDVEREFWRLVTSIEETVEVEYGADIHCTTHGSGFPTAERNPCDPYSTDPWNLNLMPLHPESLFRHIKSDISGMTVPWVYVGMIFSTFCWHNEDHFAYSINYQHFGATKTWYGIPADDTEKFEKAMMEAVPELFETQPDLLFQLVTLLTPEHLKKAGVRVYAVDQRAGQLVITFPQAYHAGFNHGFNFNEAVNFAPSDWEPYGFDGVERLQQFRRQPCFSHDELLWTAAEGTSSMLTIQTAKWLAPALGRVRKRELGGRDDFFARHGEDNHDPCSLNVEPAGNCSLDFEVLDEDVPEEEYQCAQCKCYAYLSRFKCHRSGRVLCLRHAGHHACCDMSEAERFAGAEHILYYRKTNDQLDETYQKVADKAHMPEAWEEKFEKLLDEGSKPALKSLRNLLNEGERIPYDLPSLPDLREFVDRCNEWVEEATNYTVRKQQNRRKNDKVWQSGLRRSVGPGLSAQELREREFRRVDNIYRLIDEAERIGFDCPEIQHLQERANDIRSFQKSAEQALEHIRRHDQESIEKLIEEGRAYNVDIPELDRLSEILEQIKWNAKARASRSRFLTLKEVRDLLEEGHRLEIPLYNDNMKYYGDKYQAGQQWESKARELINAEIVHYPQLEALSNQVQSNSLPVSADTLAAVDQILHKQREAHRQIIDITERSLNPDYRKRPKYAEVVEIMKKLEDLNSKPTGTLDLEKEQRRHEDWMRKGKKLFGKTNAPLHILKSHMEYVLERNLACFDIRNDTPRLPAEPASRAASEEGEAKVSRSWEDPTQVEVFCICRRIEAGMMIECELCHEWYHGKCLKIARGKVKEDDKYTCPICDWRVKIPRDAARPKLEELISWQEEIPTLPFQPEEEELLKKIIDNAQEFRNHISAFCNPVLATPSEADTQRFYLRKIEGAEILLSMETNFFRQELHKWSPVAPEPPPVLEISKSTRKPRPTKLQKMLAQYGVEDPDDLPENMKSKANSLKRKAMNAEAAAAAAAASSTTGLAHPNMTSPTPHSFATGNHSFFSRGSQPSTPSLAGAPHAHAPQRSNSISSSRPGSSLRPDPLEMGNPPGLHPDFFISGGNGGPGPSLAAPDSTLAFEDRLPRGQDDGINLSTDAGKAKALEMLRLTETGRKRAEEIFGPGVWNSRDDAFGSRSNIGQGQQEDDKDVDKMFQDLTNADDEDDPKKDRQRERDRQSVTADSFEAERNAMDMEDSD
ncbi:jumonji superfamily protein [Durotheca rogersii]|uniref:jumonji superfamily protein n=1 Tax=Durotheca rogersii TaxID=419775 RepID=UPI0022211440|nr:jumonji superfamily protein [Durotheca rogersii]KAI5857437.1 jumonji superfamily protein [Durotheca rogersii]